MIAVSTVSPGASGRVTGVAPASAGSDTLSSTAFAVSVKPSTAVSAFSKTEFSFAMPLIETVPCLSQSVSAPAPYLSQ